VNPPLNLRAVSASCSDVPIDPPVTTQNIQSVDQENPWPGLSTFTEEQSAFFFGRDEEVRELLRRVERKALTVLFGQSGLGKSSLLQAGLFPRLRTANFCPIYVRLDHSASAPAPTEQIKSLVFQVTASAGSWTKTGSTITDETLWEFFHHRDDNLHDAAGKVVVPVLVFDQFEELFTLGGASDPETRRRANGFIAELADLVENRPPVRLEERMEESSAEAEAFDFTRADYRVLITLREDYLPHLESLKSSMPSLMQNRMRLTRMQADRALEAVMKPAAGLVTQEVAIQIVGFVAGRADLEGTEVEPSLLNLICRELNNQRRAQGEAVISANLLAGTRETILREFYERTMADQPPAVRHFVENELLTDSGYRENIALERARKHLVDAGANPSALDVLVNRRLLRIEERLDVRRVELTHDVLCSVVKASRDLRHQREALEKAKRLLAEQQAREAGTRQALNRARKIAAVCAVLMLIAAANAIFGVINLRRARAAETLAERARGEAEKLVGFLIEDFYTELEPTGRLETMGKLAHMAVAYYDGLPPELLTSGTQVYRGMALVREGTVLQARGDSAGAAKIIGDAQTVFEKLRADGDQSDGPAVGLALALLSKGSMGGRNTTELFQQAADLLRPRVEKAGSSRRVRRVYADVLNFLSSTQPKETAIATCEEARKILVGLGALDLSDLGATSAYGDTSDSEARHALALGRLDDAERLQREVLGLAEKVLAQRPGDLRAMVNRSAAPEVLAQIAVRRFDYAGALVFAAKADQAAADYVRFNPDDVIGWQLTARARQQTVNCLLAQGKVGDALAQARSAVALEHDARNTAGIFDGLLNLWTTIALAEAQLGHRPAAEEALKERRRMSQLTTGHEAGETFVKLLPERQVLTESAVGIIFGDYETAYADSSLSAARIKKIPVAGETGTLIRSSAYRDALANATLAALRLEHGADAEATARALLDEPMKDAPPDRIAYSTAWKKVLLAHALGLQGRRADAQPMLDSSLAYFREQQSKLITGVGFLQRVARVISGTGAQVNKATASVEFSYRSAYASYVQGLFQPDDSAGRTARRDALEEAVKTLQGIPEESKQLHDWKELNDLIFKARLRPGK
jgi:tetratricopeptide (TPR) repeat protein